MEWADGDEWDLWKTGRLVFQTPPPEIEWVVDVDTPVYAIAGKWA